LRLWYQCYDRKLATPASPTQQAIFDMGHEVGLLATKLYPGGLYVFEDYMHHPEAKKQPNPLLPTPTCLPSLKGHSFSMTFGYAWISWKGSTMTAGT